MSHRVNIRRLPLRLERDASRTIPRLFWLGEERSRKIIDRVTSLAPEEVHQLLQETVGNFKSRHVDLYETLRENFDEISRRVHYRGELSDEARLLTGAYFTMEYAFESAALFNPAMVPAMDQSGLQVGQQRFIMSLRAVGEGHVSSIVFRKGIVDADGNVSIEPPHPTAKPLRHLENPVFKKESFYLKLIEMGGYHPAVEPVFESLGERFRLNELQEALYEARRTAGDASHLEESTKCANWVAHANYHLKVEDNSDIEDFVLFPMSQMESQGMEDMRLVRFHGGEAIYYGTYTAFNGERILPQLLEIGGDNTARVHTLHGKFAQNKGLALFPRQFGKWYVMLGRVDGENLYLMKSTNVRFWNDAEIIVRPKYDWEFVQIGNCGSPIETDKGWLVLTHGVGPMRQYSMGAVLLDLNDPTKVLGRLDEPLLEPSDEERAGYVPNVVYSCGAMTHDGQLVVPYGISDAATGFAVCDLDELLKAMLE
ncbi:MAG: glycoside hydrolase family 130 protein [Phycisphaerae bacterium]